MKTTIYKFTATFGNGEIMPLYFADWDQAKEMHCFYRNLNVEVTNITEQE